MRAIDADALKEYILRSVPNWSEDREIVLDCIANSPTIEERKKGKWYKPNGVMPPEHFGRHRCSVCETFAMHDWKHHREQLTDYCPNCGADMRGGDDE